MGQLEPIVIDPKTFLRQHYSLPALPEVLTRVQEEINSDDVSVAKIAEIVITDPSLVAQVLKVVNSAYYSLPKEIIDVKLAVAYLGINEVYRIILSISVINTLASGKKNDFKDIWFHSIYTAQCARYLARKFEPHLPLGELWAAAVLHDVGKLVYLKFFPEHFLVLNKHRLDNGCLFSEAENYFDMPPSSYLGSLLCEFWRLPDKIREACVAHTLDELKKLSQADQPNSFIRVICLANLLATLTTDQLEDEIKKQVTTEIKQNYELTDDKFMLMLGSISELKMETEKFML